MLRIDLSFLGFGALKSQIERWEGILGENPAKLAFEAAAILGNSSC